MQLLKSKRGKKLRKYFDLDEKYPLYNRDLRNAWEHFDERLDKYLLGRDSVMFFPTCKIVSHNLANDPVDQYFKLLDIVAECLVLMKNKYFFGPIRLEVERVANKINDFAKNGIGLNINS